ncbi:hypothetical protein GJ744_009380 [Endocarpon pusillum]|uniref:HTH psq-type domain-containing protein n=1 Tax=Endocarpon pusillum TaxID=364733 RepID=A0A8H7E2S0_9EURO|nr:hypothetical protein GJ744_009380 [Endocarpon pusillum]
MAEREPDDLQDDIIERAAEDYRKRIEAGGNPGALKKWAEQYGVSRYRLMRRLKGIGPRRDRIPVNRKLSEAQEAALVQYIRDMDDIGTSIPCDPE